MKVIYSKHLFQAIVVSIFFCCIISCKDDDDGVEPTNGELKIDIDANYINKNNPTSRLWFMISDVNGKVISVKEAANGEQIVFKYPNSVKDANVYLSEITARIDNSVPYCYVTTYLVPRLNEFTYARAVAKDIIGTSKITLTNFTPYTSNYFLSSGGDISSSIGVSNTWNLEVRHHKNPDDVFIFAIPSGQTVPKYKWITGVEINKEYQADFTTFQAMTLSAAITVPTNKSFFYVVQGYTSAVDAQPMAFDFATYSDGRTSFKPYLPASGFSQYKTTLQYHVGNETFEICKFGSIPSSFTKPSLSIDVVKEELNDFSFNTSGDYDFVSTQFSNSDMSFAWTVLSPPGGTVTGKLPALPATITNAFSFADVSTLSLSEIRIQAADEITGYDDLIQKSMGHYYYTTKGYTTLFKRDW